MKFHSFTLDNDLQVLAISDDRFVKSSAALAVMAGSMQNPDDQLGLAHFLEHMLFLGTKEFPEVGEYENYLNKNGGGHNAYTSIDHTNYFFDVDHSAYEGAVQRFSRFFVSPTFDPKFVEREKNAVNSEHEKNLKDDSRREYRFQQIIADPKHPYSKFATGDIKTLAKSTQETVMDFYKKNYSSNLMRLVLMSDLPPEDLEKMARKYFSDIPNQKKATPTYSDKLFAEEGLPKLHWVETVRDKDILKVSFDIPDDMPFWESKPTVFMAHLLGDEGEGSLLSYLKKKGWALGLSTSTWWRMFNIRVTMTEKGREHYQDIIEAIFSYIKLMNKEGLKENLFEERKALAMAELSNIEPQSSMSRASDYSSSMLYYPVDDFLSHHYLYHKYSPEDFSKFMSYLQVANMQASIFTSKIDREVTEDYYGIHYKSLQMPEAEVEKYKNAKILPELQYPEPNPYIPTNLDLVKKEKIYPAESEAYRDKSMVYAQVDTDLGIPKASINISFISDIIKGDPKKYLLAKIFAAIKKEELNEWGYPARLAGLHYGIDHGNNTISIEVSGYSHHLGQLLKDLIFDQKHSRRIDEAKIDKDYFEKIKTRIKKTINNKDHDAAYQQLLYEMGHLISTSSVHRKDYADLVGSITLEEVNDFAKQFFSKVAIRAYAYGNVELKSVHAPIDLFLEKITDKTLNEEDVQTFENKYVKLDDKKYFVPVKGENNNNAELTLYRFNDWTIAEQAKVEIISRLIEQPFFTELRTHQQLGYIVAAFSSTSNGFVGLGTLIQSQNFEPVDVQKRSSDFLSDLLKKLSEEIKDDDIEPIKAALINEITKQPNSLGGRLSRFTTMAATYHGDFQFFEKLKNDVAAVDASGLKGYLKEHLLDKAARSQITLLYYGTDAKNTKPLDGFEKVDDYKAFKAKHQKIQPYRNSSRMK
ncbi:MAG: insulinase family protein [Bdellovibrionales bacterium]|nr:insulinase family protein [Bdellovibrionales bacterium]